MADGSYRYQQQPGAGQFYYPQHNQQNHHQRQLARNGSPVNSGRTGYNNDTPSPSRSPVSQSSSQNPFGMFNQGHQPGQHVMMNGGNGHQRYMQMNMTHKYQHQSHQQHHNQQNHHHQQNHGGGHGGIGHQHTFSSGALSNSTPHFTPSTLHNGTQNGNQGNVGENVSAEWQQQMQLAAESRQTVSQPHHHCKKDGAARSSKAGSLNSLEDEPKEGTTEERIRATTSYETRRQDWAAMDLSGQGLRAIAPMLFSAYTFLDKLYIDNNKLTHLPPSIGRLKNLSHLNAANNELLELPEEIGMLVNLRSLLVFDNNLHTLPFEIGYLYQLEILGIDGNPLNDDLKAEIVQNGTRSLVNHLKENTEGKPTFIVCLAFVVTDSLQLVLLQSTETGMSLMIPPLQRNSQCSHIISSAINTLRQRSTAILRLLHYPGNIVETSFSVRSRIEMPILCAYKKWRWKATMTTSGGNWRSMTTKAFSGRNQGRGQCRRKRQNSSMGVRPSTRVPSTCVLISR